MENTEEKKENYTLFWSGEEISAGYLSTYYANELDEIKDKNFLLGEFTPNGKYVFNAEIKKALVAIKKRVDDKNENSYFLIAKTLKNVFTFKMRVFEVEDNNLLAANLYLIEVVDDERFNKPLKTFVAQYVDKKNDEFINKAKYIFNIIVDGEFNEFEKQENETIMAPVLPKTRERNEVALDVASENFIELMLEELEKTEEGKKIKEEFEKATHYSENKEKAIKMANEKDEDKKEPIPKPNYRALKKKLDSIIEKKKGYEVIIKANPEIKKAIEKYNQAVEQEKRTSAQTELMPEDYKKIKEEIKKDEPKKESSPSAKKPATKSDGGKSSGGGGSKKNGKGGGGGGGSKKKAPKKKKDDKKKPYYAGFVVPKHINIPIIKLGTAETSKKKTEAKPKISMKPKLKSPTIVSPKIPSKSTKQVVFEDVTKVKKFDDFLEDDFSDDLEAYSKFNGIENVNQEYINDVNEKEFAIKPEKEVLLERAEAEMEIPEVVYAEDLVNEFVDLKNLQEFEALRKKDKEKTIR